MKDLQRALWVIISTASSIRFNDLVSHGFPNLFSILLVSRFKTTWTIDRYPRAMKRDNSSDTSSCIPLVFRSARIIWIWLTLSVCTRVYGKYDTLQECSIVPLLSVRGQWMGFKIKICGHVDVCFNPVVVG